MKVNKRFYEPDQGLEEIQAMIYNSVMEKYNENPATVDQIKTRYNGEDFDPKGVCYAFSDDEQPLAYIQTRVIPTQKRTFIGYPWAKPNCPLETQEQLFTEMLSYIKERDPDHTIVMGNIKNHWSEVHEFAQAHHMKVNRVSKQYSLDPSKISTLDVSDFEVKTATTDDIDALFTLAKTEEGLIESSDNEEEIKKFFEQIVTERKTFLIYKEDQLVSAGVLSVTAANNPNFFVQFTATNPEYIDGWKVLIIKLAQEAVKNGWEDKAMIVVDNLPNQIAFYEEQQAQEIIKTLYEVP
ncbi:MAG: hypothetical protein ACXAC7_11355 [Candidatus Hodarchaeales archaeon]|jgi:hypothetical protein